jgi:undecaprenyl-diphosphatase
LGVVEGVTEYLPISSTGHLILFGEALQFTGDKAKSFEVIIQVGAILSVLILYKERFFALFRNLGDTSTALAPGIDGLRGMVKLAATTLPALVMGALFQHTIKEKLFTPLAVALAAAFGAIVILIIEGKKTNDEGRGIEDLTLRQAIVIGCIQCFALWPGMSRSGSAIIGGMLAGLNRRAAAEYSFLAAVPVLAAAAAHDLLKALPTLDVHDAGLLAIGFVVSFVTALVTVKWFIGIVSRYSLRPFAYYRLALAALVLFLLR